MTTLDGPARRASASAVAVERAVDVLAHLAREQHATVGDLAEALSVGSSAVHRILTALRNKGLVEQDPLSDRYRLAWGVLALTRPVRGESDLRALAREHLRELRELTRETVSLHVRSRFERLCIDQVESPQAVRWVGLVGQWSSLDAGATGRAILAALPDDEIAEYEVTLGRRALLDDLAFTRARGNAVVIGERIEGLAGLSAPILDAATVVGAVTVAGPADRWPADLEPWAEHLLRAAGRISALLGHRGG